MAYRVIKYISKDDWLHKREQGISSTDVAGILGIDAPYNTPYSVWQRKVTPWDPEKVRKSNDAMEFGLEVEGVIAKRFAQQTGFKVRNSNGLFQHTGMPYLISSIDRFVYEDGERGILEIKTASRGAARKWDESIPMRYYTQVCHQMFVLDVEFVYIALWITDTREIIPYRIERDDVYLKKQNAILTKFWNDNVLANVPPNRKAIDFDRSMVQPGTQIEATPDVAGAVFTLRDLKKQIGEYEESVEDHEEIVKEFMGDNEILVFNDVPIVNWKNNPVRSRFDEAAFKEDHRELYDVYCSDTAPSRRFTIVKPKGEKKDV